MSDVTGQIQDVGFGADGFYRVRIRLQSKKSGKDRGTFSETVKGKNKQEATRLAKNRLKKLVEEKNLPKFLNPHRETLNTAFKRYLKEVKAPVVRRQTLEDYGKVYDRYVKETLGVKVVGKITREDVQGLYNSLQVTGRTVRYLNMILKAAFKDFIHRDYITKNPCEGVVLPKHRTRDYKAFSRDELNKLFAAASPYWRTLIAFAVETGLRPEEYMALTWKHVSDKRVKVERALVRFAKGEYSFSDPKNKSSRRTVPLTDELARMLHDHRIAMLERKLKAGAYWENLDLVFPTEIGTPFTISNINRKFKALLTKAGLPRTFRLYDLRHTCATMMLERGLSIKIVAERLGHSSIRVTADTYLHVSEGMQEMAASVFEGLFVSDLCQDSQEKAG